MRAEICPHLAATLQDLRAHGITVWRDQDSLYGGQNWPKAIGEAIAAHDVLLLVWSQGGRSLALLLNLNGTQHWPCKKHPAVLAGSDATPSSAQRHQRH